MTRESTRKTRNELLTRKLIICGLLGAAIGAGIGFIWATRDDSKRLPERAGGKHGITARQPIRPNEVLKLGLSLVNVTRQISDLVDKV